jgi:hypothetical protein
MGDCVECCWAVHARRLEGRGKGEEGGVDVRRHFMFVVQ